jgi:hypothetical protein
MQNWMRPRCSARINRRQTVQDCYGKQTSNVRGSLDVHAHVAKSGTCDSATLARAVFHLS